MQNIEKWLCAATRATWLTEDGQFFHCTSAPKGVDLAFSTYPQDNEHTLEWLDTEDGAFSIAFIHGQPLSEAMLVSMWESLLQHLSSEEEYGEPVSEIRSWVTAAVN